LLSACSNQAVDQPTLSSTSKTEEKITLRLAHGWPKGFPYFAESVDDYVKLVNEMSDGRISIKVDRLVKLLLIIMVAKTLTPSSFHPCHLA